MKKLKIPTDISESDWSIIKEIPKAAGMYPY
jgi:hypothetical protein